MQFKDIVSLLICVKLYFEIIVPVFSIHVRTPLIATIWSSLGDDWQLTPWFRNDNTSLFTRKSILNTNNRIVLNKKLNWSNTLTKGGHYGSILNHLSHKQIKGFIINKINMNMEFSHDYLIRLNRLQGKQRRKVDPYDLEGGCWDVYRSYNRKVWPRHDYKNSMDVLIEMYNTAQKLYLKYGNWTVVFKKMGLKPPKLITRSEKASCARSIFSIDSPPDHYVCKLFNELGITPKYDKVSDFFKNFKKKIESTLLGDEEVPFVKNDKYAFGIEPLDNPTPISEKSLRGYLEEGYDHLKEVVRCNPEKARKMLTVLHRIYKPLDLVCDDKKEVSDHEILDDYNRMVTSKTECMLEFSREYPELKFPMIDDDYLDLYRHWYDRRFKTSLELSSTMKENFLETYRQSSRVLEKLVFDPILGAVAGVALGKASELLAEYLYERQGPQFEFLHKNKDKLKYIVGSIPYLLLTNRKNREDYFNEVIKLLYKDVRMLEEGDVKGLWEHISKFSSKLNRISIIDIMIGDLAQVYESDFLKRVMDVRRQNLVDLGIGCKVNDKEFRTNLEDVATILVFNSILKMYKTLPRERTYNSNIFTIDELYGVEPQKEEEKEEPDDPMYAYPMLPEEEGKKEKWPKAKYTLTSLHERNGEYDSRGKLGEYVSMVNSLKYICSICLPLSKTSVYRLLYTAAKYLGNMDCLPASPEGEVVGHTISGEDFVDGTLVKDDDYSFFYRKKDEEAGLPPENAERAKHNAMVFACVALHVFSNMEDFVSCTEPKDFGGAFEKKEDESEKMRPDNVMPPLDPDWEGTYTLREIEDWAESLKENNGYIRRENIKTKYGYFQRNEVLGDDQVKLKRKQTYENEKLRDELLELFVKKDRIEELIKGLSMVLGVSEEFMLRNMPNQWLNFVANMIYNDLRGGKGDLTWYKKGFNMSEEALEQVKHRVMMVHLQSLNGKYKLSGVKYSAKNRDEWLNEVFTSIKDIGDKMGLSQEKIRDHYRVYTFRPLIDELRQLDLKNLNKEQMDLIKRKYKSSDIVLVNALTNVIKEKVVPIRVALNEAVVRRDQYLVGSRTQNLVDMYKGVMTSMEGLVDEKYKYRLERALTLNNEKKPHHYELNEIVGTEYYGPLKKLLWPDGTDRWVKREKYDARERGLDKLKELNGDWELMDEEDGLNDLEKRELGLKREEKKMLRPLKMYCRDTVSTNYEQAERDRLVKEGKIPKEMRYIPNEFHLGGEKRDPEYDMAAKKPEDMYKKYRPVMETKEIYQAWIMYNYWKRGPENKEEFIRLFPAAKRLIENPIRDWKYLYIRMAIRNDDIKCTRDWLRELYQKDYDKITEKEKEECRRALEYCYEEEVLRRTKGPMEQVEDDLGNTEDFFFDPFEISNNCRMRYVYSLEMPDDKGVEYLEKLQKLLQITPKQVEEVHSKCFHLGRWRMLIGVQHLLERYYAKVLNENQTLDLEKLQEKYFKPQAQRLKVSEVAYKNIVDSAVFENVAARFREVFDKTWIGPELIENVDEMLEMCLRYKIISEKAPRQDIAGDSSRIIEDYVLSLIREHNRVDAKKVTYLCNLLGYHGKAREELLEDIGKRFYYKYMMEHHQDNIYMETFEQFEHLHDLFGLNEQAFKRMIYDYRLFKVLELYNHGCGFEAFDKMLPIVLEDKVTKYLPLKKTMKEDWLIFVLQDFISKKKVDLSHYLEAGESEASVENGERRKANPLVEWFQLMQEKLDMSNKELLEGLFFHVYDDANPFFVEVVKALYYTKDSAKMAQYRGMLATRVPREMPSLLKPQGGVYDMIVDLLKILALTPKKTTPQIAREYAMDDTRLVRKFISENARSEQEKAQMLKLVDLYLERQLPQG
ncbi:uncharacterized protein TOT_020000215 [Theileria orientalis strain Shintoku]|uniref:Uncharacterized protein n=1 Tax=Theileria orientalis strain Shintoku TaxID=869250 RepID=J4DP20_THEOR|nr:uncharacterized protein TOT_020000215 [Theileria orientalis strain Shintoku]BAM39944.1 uncharacterized protein TOT_020000215 [Theileria orientalis strain Shintoku]|eukprot:XP_009690245.1 uncharacterized protein TOT_020000215 [Theileria orientalis strain Shintoku]